MANTTISLTKFVLEFEKIAASWRSSETEEDFHYKQGMSHRKINTSRILNHAAKVHTGKIYKLFKRELLNSIAITYVELALQYSICVFEVMGEGIQSRAQTVHFNESNLDISCTCKKFESMSLLCSHALRVFNVKILTKLMKNIF